MACALPALFTKGNCKGKVRTRVCRCVLRFPDPVCRQFGRGFDLIPIPPAKSFRSVVTARLATLVSELAELEEQVTDDN